MASQIPIVTVLDMHHLGIGRQHVHEKSEILATRKALVEGRTDRLYEIAPNQLIAQRTVQVATQDRLTKRGCGWGWHTFGPADFRTVVRWHLDPPFPCQVGVLSARGGKQSRIHARIHRIVRVSKDEVFAIRRRKEILPRSGDAQPYVMAKNPRARRETLFVQQALQRLDGTVRRGIVAKDKLGGGNILRRKRGDEAAQKARALAYRHKNRKRRLDRRHSTTFQLSR